MGLENIMSQEELKENFTEFGNYNIIYYGSTFGKGLHLGHFCILYPNLRLDDGIQISDRVTIGENPEENLQTCIGENSKIFSGAMIQSGVKSGKNLILATNAVIRKSSELGEKVIIGLGSEIGSNVKIGSDVKMNSHVFVPDYSEIGDHTYLGPYVVVTNTLHPRCPELWQCIKQTGVKVHDYAKIGAGSLLLPGVEIGEHAIVGAGSVVTKDVNPYEVVIGNPAKKLKDAREITCRDEINLISGSPYYTKK